MGLATRKITEKYFPLGTYKHGILNRIKNLRQQKGLMSVANYAWLIMALTI